MKPSTPRYQVIALIGWIATVALAFSFGRLTTGSRSDSEKAANQRGVSPGSATSGAGGENSSEQDAAIAALRAGQFSKEGRPETLAALTHGQPLDKWIKKLLSQEDSIVRMTGMLQLLDLLKDPADFRAALEAINLRSDRGFGRGSRFTEFGMVLEKWAQMDPKGAIEFTQGQNGGERYFGSSTVLRTWARTDPSAAIAWAQTEGKAAAADENQPDQRGGRGDWMPSALSTVISQLAQTDLDRALTVAAGETFDRRSRTLDTLASEMVNQRGIDAARKAVDDMPAGSLKDGLISQLAGRVAAKDPSGAAEWILSMPPGDTRSRALADTISTWAQKDPTAAGSFLTGLPASPELDRSRESYASNVVRTDPEGAMAWAASITEEERRQRTVENVARSWMRQDAATATAWLAQSTLPDATKQRIQSPPRSSGGFGPGGPGRGPGRGPGN